jgi:hypothetical protein
MQINTRNSSDLRNKPTIDNYTYLVVEVELHTAAEHRDLVVEVEPHTAVEHRTEVAGLDIYLRRVELVNYSSLISRF